MEESTKAVKYPLLIASVFYFILLLVPQITFQEKIHVKQLENDIIANNNILQIVLYRF